MATRQEIISSLSQPASGIAAPSFEIDETPAGRVGGFIISETFAELPQIDRQNMVWNYLDTQFRREDLLNIVTLVTVTPSEVKTTD